MRKLLFSLAGGGALALSVPGAARALPAGTTFALFRDDGPSQTATGTLLFQPGAPVAGGACRYRMQWSTGFDTIPEATCVVDEATWIGHVNCKDNSLVLMNSIVVRAPGQSCDGFDETRQLDVFQLVLGERDAEPSFVGLLQFTAASDVLFGVMAWSAS